MYIPAKAVIPDKVYVVCDRQQVIPGAIVDVRLASVYQKTKPNNVNFVVDNLFKGPFKLEGLRGTNAGYGGTIIADDIFPFVNKTVRTRCWLPDWSVHNLIMSGAIGKRGYLSSNIKMCAVTYGAHYTLVIKDEDIYDKIPKHP